MHRYAFASALSLALHHHACLINALFVLHPHYPSLCTTTLASLVKGRWIDGKAQTVALLRFACDTSTFLIYQTFCRQDGGIASPPSLAPRQPFQNRTIPRKSPTHLPPLSKVRCCRLKKFGRLPEGLLHHPSHNYNKPLLRHHTSQRRQLTRIGKHKKNPNCLFWQWGFCLVSLFYFKYLPTSTAGAEVSDAGLPEQSSVYPPTEIPVISPLPSSVSV